jgi:4-amino-4-deoxy-L-arabinose transferase-like glycosyltransferase
MIDQSQIEPAASVSSEPAEAEADSAVAASGASPQVNFIPAWLAAISRPQIALPILIVVGALMFLLNLGSYPLYTKGEPREAVTVFDIVHGGVSAWILPMRAGVEIPSKPLMMHWLGALVSLGNGSVSEWTVRLPSATLAICGVLACYLYSRRLFDQLTGLIAAIILASAFQYVQAGGGARVDMTLTFFLEIAFFEFALLAEGLVQRTTPMYLAIAAAVLSKGPVGIAMPMLVVGIWVVIERRFDLVRRLDLLRGTAIVAVVDGGWYLLAIVVGGSAFFRKQILAENVFTFLYNRHLSGGHAHPFYYVELTLLLGFMPWTPLLAAAAVSLATARARIQGRTRYLIVWFVAVLAFYNLAHSKRGVYLLALYPAIAVITGVFVRDSIARGASDRSLLARWLSFVYGTLLLFGGAAALLGLAILWTSPMTFQGLLNPIGITTPGFMVWLKAAISEKAVLAILLPGVIAAMGSYLIRARQSFEKLVAATALAVCAFATIVNLYLSPAIANALTLRNFTADALRMVGSHDVAYLGVLNYDVAFYSGCNIPIDTIFDKTLPEYLITGGDYVDSLPDSIRRDYSVVLRSNPTELDGTAPVVLLKRGRWAAAASVRADQLKTATACGARRSLEPIVAAAAPIHRAG